MPTPEEVEQARREWAEVEVTCAPVVISAEQIKAAFIAAGIGPRTARQVRYNTTFIATIESLPRADEAEALVLDPESGLPAGWPSPDKPTEAA